jgi:hypothetical protein
MFNANAVWRRDLSGPGCSQRPVFAGIFGPEFRAEDTPALKHVMRPIRFDS